MREGHPIDERFKALYDAEAAPPEAVHEALAARMGWSGRSGGGVGWRPWLMAAGAIVVVGLAIGVWVPNGSAAGSEEASGSTVAQGPKPPTEMPAALSGTSAPAPYDPQNENNSGKADADPYGTAPSTGEMRGRSPEDHGRSAAAASRAKTRGAAAAGDLPVAREHEPVGDAPNAEEEGGVLRSTIPGIAHDQRTKERPSVTSFQGVNSPDPTEPYLDPELSVDPLTRERIMRMDPLAPMIAPVAPGSTFAGQETVGYVLPHGTWWLAPYAGMGVVNGQWHGAGSSALSQAEHWRSTTQFGVLLGREWRSGWSVSGGLGLARVRSTFAHQGEGAQEVYTDVDTTWVENVFPGATTDITIYSWTIDSLTETRTGAGQRIDARNRYGAVQVPLMLAWHTNARRLRYGAFAGVTAWIPTSRKGLTLVQAAPDSAFVTTTLGDDRVSARFSPQLHGQVGLSLGYSLSERLGAYAEPMISTPLVSFDGREVPWLTRPLLQIRLQYEFASKAR
ncbi:MAG: hypothetical protein JNM62_06665 [Flavobacteriales bacterium]|nr:hypothetical protein [Flavobacteriales bacterium]